MPEMTHIDQWLTPPLKPGLDPNEVHIWRVPLAQPPTRVQHLARLLSKDESTRAERFRFERHRRRYIVSQGTLRSILGRYLGLEPIQVCFYRGIRGKPYLNPNPDELMFNLAHSHELAVVALVSEHKIGVDLERIQTLSDAASIAANFFSAGEKAALQALPDSQKLRGFFNGWTRKEAFVKAIGEGLAHPLDQFEVSLTPGEPAQLRQAQGDDVGRWSLKGFEPAPDYVGALAVQGPIQQIHYWQFA